MKFIHSTIFLCLASIIQSQCTTPTLRKEIRELTNDEYTRYVNAVKALHKRSSPDQITTWETFAKKHNDDAKVNGHIHNTPSFLPWHRRFIQEYEKELRNIDPEVFLPYFDWSLDSIDPHHSVVLTKKWIGGNGNPAHRNALETGPFSNTQLQYPENHVINRNFRQPNGKALIFSSLEFQSLINMKSYSEFAGYLELAHNDFHIFIGGEMGAFTSPNDPIFFLHHAFIDLIWTKWQERNPKAPYEGTSLGKAATQNDLLFNYPETVLSTLDSTKNIYCFQYPSYPRSISFSRSIDPILSSSLNQKLEGLDMNEAIEKLKQLSEVTISSRMANTFLPEFAPLPEDYIKMMQINRTLLDEFQIKRNQFRDLARNLL